MIFKFRMLSDENEDFVREYEVSSDMNLLDFNNFICSDLNYESNMMTSFFTADSRWEKQQEYTSADMGSEEDASVGFMPRAMSSACLGELAGKAGDRLIYVFDMLSERAYYLVLTEVSEHASGASYPRVAHSAGQPAEQFGIQDEEEPESIFDEIMSDFDDFSGFGSEDDYGDDEY